MKKKSKPKSSARSKPERKPKSGKKGAPRPKSKSEPKSAPSPEKDAKHKDPTVEGGPGDQSKMYGGFVLRRFDHDRRGEVPAVYDGQLRKVIFKEPIKTAVATGRGTAAVANVQDQDTLLIAKLRDHLWTLGFWVFPRVNKDGVVGPETSDAFDWRVEWAVREFQIAAAMPYVAVQDVKKKPSDEECKAKGKYLSTLSAKQNDAPIGEPPTGVVTQKTATTIKHWLEHNYRCPVVVQAFTMKNKVDPCGAGAKKSKTAKKKPKRVRDSVLVENIWRHDEVVSPGVQMYAWDYSGHYEFPEGRSNEGVYVGNYYQKAPPFGGPISKQDESWSEAKLGPESWLGQAWDEMDNEHKSTWRAIMAVAAQECGGGLDIVNFWDNCLGSAGHFHWTMPKADGSTGEFCGLIALLEAKFPTAFQKCFGAFGLWGPLWHDVAETERPKVKRAAVCGGYLYIKDPEGKLVRHPVAGRASEAVWLRSWQNAYRLEMAARTCKEYRQAMWEYAKHRLEMIRVLDDVDQWLSTGSKAGKAKLTLADIFTSERGVAFSLRLHVWRPAFLQVSVEKKNVYPILHDALRELLDAGTLKDKDGKEIPPSEWTAKHESALIDVMVRLIGEKTKMSARASMQRARYWPLEVADKEPFDLVMKKVNEKREGPYFLKLPWIPEMPSEKEPDEKEKRKKMVAEFGPAEGRGKFTFCG